MYITGGIICILVGLFMLIYPNTFYEITQSWKNDSAGEPSKLFIVSTRLGGGVFLLAGVLGIVAALFLS